MIIWSQDGKQAVNSENIDCYSVEPTDVSSELSAWVICADNYELAYYFDENEAQRKFEQMLKLMEAGQASYCFD